VELYDLAGRRIRVIASGCYAAGHQRGVWDGLDARVAPVRDGVYVLRARSAGLEQRLKLAVIRR